MPGSGKPDSREVYADIIDLPAWEPGPDHPRMDLNQRAAQFLPFAALTGFDEVIQKASMETEREIERTDGRKKPRNRKINAARKICFDMADNPDIPEFIRIDRLLFAGGETVDSPDDEL